jgi:hypothetical protein
MTPPYTRPVDQLLKLGRPESPWLDYPAMGLSRADVPSLIRLMQDDDLRFMEEPEDWPNDEDLPEWYAGIHAWRALGQLKAEEAIPAILEIFPQIDDDNDWLSSDSDEIFAQIGPAAIAPLRAYLLDETKGIYSRGTAGETLKGIALRHPETRADCVGILVDALEGYLEQDEGLNAFLISDLVELNAVEHIELIEQAFASDRVDEMVRGDIEDIKIELGLLTERLTPRRPPTSWLSQHRQSDAQYYGSQPAKQAPSKKEKSKRKQEKKSRKKNRKKK